MEQLKLSAIPSTNGLQGRQLRMRIMRHPESGLDRSLDLVAERLRDGGEAVVAEALPKRWVDLLLFLDEQERRQESLSGSVIGPRAALGSEKGAELAGRSILVVEDEPLIRLDLTRRLEDAGATVLAASHLKEALVLADHPDLSAGVLDFDLGAADITPVCWRLLDRRIPFVFHAGRVDRAFRQWPLAPVILKPSTHGLIATVAALFR